MSLLAMSLPAEIWAEIFDLASDDDLLQVGIHTSLAESAYCKIYRGNFLEFEWSLRSPEQAMEELQRQSYATKQAIISTCTQWRKIGSDILFRSLYFSHATKVVAFCALLATSSYGLQTKRIHIGPYIYPGNNSSVEEYQQSILSVIRHCPNIELFIVERRLGPSFGPIMDALAFGTPADHLHTIRLVIPGESVSKVIWGLSALPRITAAHIDIETNASPTEDIADPGSVADSQLRLPCLQQISLRGYMGTLLEQLGRSDLPSLHILSLEDGTSIDNPPDVAGFLKHHGSSLVLLDLNTYVNIPLILDLCPNLHTFVFNADFRIEPHDDVASKLVNQPHHLTTIGLQGVCCAFGVGTRFLQLATYHPADASYAAHSNDLIMGALNKSNFPNLSRIRLVSRTVLEDLNNSDGPSETNGGGRRWSRWSKFANAGIQLEDCTGQPLGTLP